MWTPLTAGGAAPKGVGVGEKRAERRCHGREGGRGEPSRLADKGGKSKGREEQGARTSRETTRSPREGFVRRRRGAALSVGSARRSGESVIMLENLHAVLGNVRTAFSSAHSHVSLPATHLHNAWEPMRTAHSWSSVSDFLTLSDVIYG